MHYGDNSAKDNAIHAFRDNSSLSIGIIRVCRDISSL